MNSRKNRFNDELIPCGCGICGQLIRRYSEKNGKERRFVNNHDKKGKKRETHPGNYKGRVRSGKYFAIYDPSHPFVEKKGYVMEHRLIYEQYHNCCILPWIYIHHKDENPENNNIYNLETTTKPDHTSLHNKGKIKVDMSDRFCLVCNSKHTYIRKNGRSSWTKYKDGWICSKCYISKYNIN